MDTHSDLFQPHGVSQAEKKHSLTDLKIDAIEACGLQSPGSSIPGVNSWPPCSLLALTHSNYGHHPRSWLVKVASRNLVTGHHPSDRVIYHDFEQIEALIQECISEQN